jgi:hypothetical protein
MVIKQYTLSNTVTNVAEVVSPLKFDHITNSDIHARISHSKLPE